MLIKDLNFKDGHPGYPTELGEWWVAGGGSPGLLCGGLSAWVPSGQLLRANALESGSASGLWRSPSQVVKTFTTCGSARSQLVGEMKTCGT